MIGIFDSGVGGMTVARAIEQALPHNRFVYFGDLARAPYGSKSPETIRGYARQNIAFLLEKGAKLIVIACNSAASVVEAEQLRQEFGVPIFEVITPAVARVVAILADHKKNRVGVIGTRATVKSGVYEEKITALWPPAQVFSVACPLLVPLVEEGWFKRRETKMIIKQYLGGLKLRQVEALVLGCTHYPLLTDLIRTRIGKRVTIIDSSAEVTAGLVHYLADHPDFAAGLQQGGENYYFVSDVTEAAQQTAERIFNRKIQLEKV